MISKSYVDIINKEYTDIETLLVGQLQIEQVWFFDQQWRSM